MSKPQIDFSKIKEELTATEATPPQRDPALPRPNRRTNKVKILVIFLIILLALIGFKAIFSGNRRDSAPISFWTQVTHLITSHNKTLQGEKDGRINFLLLGIGGLGHDGPYLTDTIMLASLDPVNKKVALISIPRDLVMPIPGYGWQRINSANAYGEAEQPGAGAELTVKTIEQVFQIPIHYYLRVDFTGFTEFIDQLDGLKICVDNEFTDNQYPTEDYKIESIHFAAGCQLMDGKTSLQFVRSRHGSNGEGSDFARNKRQQKIILAVKDKLLSFSTLANPLTIKNIYNQYVSHIATNMEIWEMLRLSQIAKGINQDSVITQGLNEGPGGQLEVVIGEDGAFLLQPPGGNFDLIRTLVKNIFGQPSVAEIKTDQQTEQRQTAQEATKAVKEKATIGIRNGTFLSGLAGKVQTRLQSLGYNVPEVGNAPFRDYEKTVLYNLTGKDAPQTIEFLTQDLKANVAGSIPSWLNLSTSDIVVVLGAEAGELEL
ncbi:LCP family protein [Candidatus Falkowbacteria bacterium]|nr:LCP family protein [Candidatus Falkowbacteria bacterium]